MKRTLVGLCILIAAALLSGCLTTSDALVTHSKSASVLTIGQKLILENVEDSKVTHEITYRGFNTNFCNFEVDGKAVNLLTGTGKSYADGKSGRFDVLCNAKPDAKGIEVQFSDQWTASIADQ